MAGLAAAPLAALPVAAQAKFFLIFFDMHSAELTPNALKLVDQIKAQIGPTARLSIVGHCDTAENGAAKLSLARAATVKKALAAAGVPATVRVSVAGKGSKDLLAPTGPKTREPQNRRVEITVG